MAKYVNGHQVGAGSGGGGSGAVTTTGDFSGVGTVASPLALAGNTGGAAGDLLTRGASTYGRLPIGLRGQFLYANNGTVPGYTAIALMPRIDVATLAALPAYTVNAVAGTLTANANGAFPAVDGVTITSGNVLVTQAGAASGIDVGVYSLTQVGSAGTPWILTRHNRLWVGESASGVFAYVRMGTQTGYVYQCQTVPGSDVVGTNALTFSLVSSPISTTAPVAMASVAAAGTALRPAAQDHVHSDAAYPLLTGARAFTGNQTFSAGVSGTVGPDSAHQHTIPSVASDTVALLAATQTLTSKTLTSPTISGPTFSGSFAGTYTIAGTPTIASPAMSGTWTGAPTFSGAVVFSGVPLAQVTDTGIATTPRVATFAHVTSAGTPAAGVGAEIGFQATNSTRAGQVDAASIAGLLTTATTGSELGALSLRVLIGGALTEKWRLWASGGTSLAGAGVAALDPGAAVVLLPNAGALSFRNAANNANLPSVNVDASNNLILGSASHAAAFIRSNGANSIYLQPGNTSILTLASGVAILGAGDATAAPVAATVRGANATGANIGATALTIAAGLPTGTGALGPLYIDGGQAGGTTGALAATQIHLAALLDSNTGATTGGDTALLLSWFNGTTRVLARVTTGVADSGGTGFRVLRVAN